MHHRHPLRIHLHHHWSSLSSLSSPSAQHSSTGEMQGGSAGEGEFNLNDYSLSKVGNAHCCRGNFTGFGGKTTGASVELLGGPITEGGFKTGLFTAGTTLITSSRISDMTIIITTTRPLDSMSPRPCPAFSQNRRANCNRLAANLHHHET